MTLATNPLNDLDRTPMNHHLTRFAALAVAGAALAPAAQASEQPFAYSYLSETLPAKALEFEQTTSYRSKKSEGSYTLWQSRTSIEYGITDRWTLSLYLNNYSVVAENNNSAASRTNYTASGDGDEVSGGGPVTFGSYVPFLDKLPLPSARYAKLDFESVSVESIYQLMSPYKDAIGLAAYVEVTHGPKVSELEFKALLQKNLLDDQLILAGNVALELEREKWSGIGVEKESKLTFSGGASYRFAPGWRAGLEVVNERGYKGHSLSAGDRDYSAWFVGPNLHYAAAHWFATLTWMEQMPWASAYSDAARVELVNGRVYKSTEKTNVRLRVGYSF